MDEEYGSFVVPPQDDKSVLADAFVVGAGLRGGAGDGVRSKAALLAQDQQAAEGAARLGGEGGGVGHDVGALRGRQRPERHLVDQSLSWHGSRTLAIESSKPNSLLARAPVDTGLAGPGGEGQIKGAPEHAGDPPGKECQGASGA